MVAAIPSDSGFVAPTMGTPGFEAFDNAQASDFVVPQIDQPDFPTDFVAPPFDPAAGGFQTEAGGPGLTQDAANDPNFVAPTFGADGGPGLTQDAANDPNFVTPTIDAAGGFGQTETEANDPFFVPPTDDPFAAAADPSVAAAETGASLDGAFAPAPAAAEPVQTFDPVAETVANVADAAATQGASQAPEAVVAEAAPEPALAPEAVAEDAPAPSAPEDPIAG